MQDFDGADVVDPSGDKIGTVERTYDDDAGTTRLVELSMGTLFSRDHRLVPVDDAQFVDGDLHVPYGKQFIEDSPDAASAGGTLEGDLLDQVRAYYQGAGSGAAANPTVERRPAAVPADEGAEQDAVASGGDAEGSAAGIGQVRDLGDVIEVPIVEEELVKRPVVKEVLRIRKTQVSDTQTVEGDVRKEDVEVVRGGDAVVRDNGEPVT